MSIGSKLLGPVLTSAAVGCQPHFFGLERVLIALGDEFVGSVDDFIVGATSSCSDSALVFSKL